MIFGNIQNLEEYPFLEEQIKECFAYAREHELVSYEKGSHEIDGDRLFVNVVEYTTTTAEERFWEAHRQYLDLHLMLRGTEQIDLNFIQNMDVKEFVEKDDSDGRRKEQLSNPPGRRFPDLLSERRTSHSCGSRWAGDN